MSQYGQTTKNPPWVRSGQNMAQNSGSLNQNLMANALPSMANAAASMLQYPQVFQGQLGQQMYGANAVGAVQYPTRGLNSAAFQTGGNLGGGGGHQSSGMNSGNNSGGSNSSSTPNKSQRVFTGTVTKLQDKFGFVNDDIFFQTSCCMKGSNPQVGDRVLVEAVYNANMPFKWNATRIQVLSNRADQGGGGGGGGSRFNNSGNMYNAVPPPNDNPGGGNRFGSGGGGSRFSNNDRSSGMNRNNDRGRNRDVRDVRGGKQDVVDDRKRKRDDERSVDHERDRDRQRSPVSKKSKSPGRRNRPVRRPPPRYTVVVPKSRLGGAEADLIHLTKRFPNLYVPSDFFLSKAKWIETFPIRSPLSLNFPCNFHVMHRDIDSPYPNDAVLEPADLDYLYVAKVMLISTPGLEELFLKTGITGKDDEASKDGSDDESVISSGSGSVTHVSRLIHFLVGTRGKEAMAIGGPWSPSLDGPNPERDPGVLVKTAIRNCKALTGIDLSACTQWFRFLEVHYHRSESVHHGKVVPARVETVVLFVPDVWSASPSRSDWETITADYKAALDRRLNPPPESPEPPTDAAADATPAAAAPAATDKSADDKEGDTSKDEEAMEEGEKEDEPKKDPTHYSQLDPKSMKVSELRDELEARGLSPKGLKSQLVARLTKAIKTEADEEEANGNVKDEPEEVERPVSPTPSSTSKKDDKVDDKKKEDDKEKEKDKKKKEELSERDKLHLEKRYRLPENPQIVVHPNRSHKSGKYDCTVTSLSSLLGYRVEDSKEHCFEVSLFAEAFNEMLMRDFGFTVYKTVVDAPAKQEEKKKEDDKDKEKKKETDSPKEKGKEEEKEKEQEKDNEKEKDDKEDKKEEEPLGGDEEKSATEDEKKKEEKKPKIIDNNIMLAFSYFDTTRCGYIHDKDLGELLYSLGLALSRSQVKKLVQKVSLRESVHYKKLAEKIKPEDGEEPMVTDEEEQWKELIAGNKKLLAVENKPETSSPTKKRGAAKDTAANLQSGFVMHNGSLVDIAKLLGQLNKSENSKIDTERALAKLKNDYTKLKDHSAKSERTIEDLQQGITKYKHKWYNTCADLNTAQDNEKMYYGVISKIYTKVAPIVEKKEEQSKVPVIELPDDEKVKDEKEGETKTVKDEKKTDKEEGKPESGPAENAPKESDKPKVVEEVAEAN